MQGVNIRAKHMRPTQANPKGGILRREMPIHISNVSPAVDGKPTRVRFETKPDGSQNGNCEIEVSAHSESMYNVCPRTWSPGAAASAGQGARIGGAATAGHEVGDVGRDRWTVHRAVQAAGDGQDGVANGLGFQAAALHCEGYALDADAVRAASGPPPGP